MPRFLIPPFGVSHRMSRNSPPTPEQERQAFWDRTTVPVNEDWKEDGTDFVNAVDVSDLFVRATGTAAQLAHDAEQLAEQLANLEHQRDLAAREQARLLREILIEQFDEVKTTWKSEMVDAFLRKNAGTRADKLAELETKLDGFDDRISVAKARLDKLRFRLKRLEVHLDWAKQTLDHEKLQMRMAHPGVR